MEYTSVVRVRLELGLAFLPPGSRGRAQKNRSGSRVGVRRRAQRSTLYVLLLCAVLRCAVLCCAARVRVLRLCFFFKGRRDTAAGSTERMYSPHIYKYHIPGRTHARHIYNIPT